MSQPPALRFHPGYIAIGLGAQQVVEGPQCQFCRVAQGLGEQCPVCDLAFEIQTTMTAHSLGLTQEV